MNPALAPRSPRCTVCKTVDALEHVALLMYDDKLEHLPTRPVVKYLRGIGLTGTPQNLYNRLVTHRKHVDRWIAKGAHVAPMQIADGTVTRIPGPRGDTRWIDVTQTAMDIGNDALAELNARLASGEMETNEVIALAKLGVSAATNRGALEQKGKSLNGIERLLQLAAGGLGNPASEGT